MNRIIPIEVVDGFDWRWLAEQTARSPQNFLAAAAEFAACNGTTMLAELLRQQEAGAVFSRVITWTLIDTRRVTLIPPGHWLLIEDSAPFRATLSIPGENAVHVQSIAAGTGHVAYFCAAHHRRRSQPDLDTVRRDLPKCFRRPALFGSRTGRTAWCRSAANHQLSTVRFGAAHQ